MRKITKLETAEEITNALWNTERIPSLEWPMLNEHDYIIYNPEDESICLESEHFCASRAINPYDLLISFGKALGIEVVSVHDNPYDPIDFVITPKNKEQPLVASDEAMSPF